MEKTTKKQTNTTERDKSLDISKKGAVLVVLTITGIVALWFITAKLVK